MSSSNEVTTWLPVVNNVTQNTTNHNDVLINGCFNNFDTVACIRSSILTFLGVLTAVLCVLKVIRLHRANHQNWHQYFIFYCASLECTIGCVHFILSTYVEFDYVLQWLKMLQFLVMCHFYWTLATRALRREAWTKRFLVPFLSIALTYFTIVAVLGIVNVKDTFIECFEPYWLMMSSAEFIIVQLFCVAGFYITRRLNEISTLDSVRRSQKRDLWFIVVVFEISAFIGMLYDVSLRIVGNKQDGCSAVFKHAQDLFSAIFLTFMISKLLLPIWVMLYVFKPTPQVIPDSDDLVPALSDDGNSAFSTNTDEQYRQLYHPADGYRSLSYDTPITRSPADSPSTMNNVLGNGGTSTVVNGNTSSVYKQNQPVQPNLGTIREESNSHQATPTLISPTSQTASKDGSTNARARQRKNITEPNQSNQNVHNGQSDQSQDNKTVLPSNKQTTGGNEVEHVPKFSIQGSDGDEEVSPVPRGKFYI